MLKILYLFFFEVYPALNPQYAPSQQQKLRISLSQIFLMQTLLTKQPEEQKKIQGFIGKHKES